MWNQLPVRNLIHMQRMAAVVQVGREVRRLQREGYSVDADRLLDQLGERIARWREEEQA